VKQIPEHFIERLKEVFLMQQRLTIGWKVSTLNSKLASLRYRAMLPVLALEKLDVYSKIFLRLKRSSLAKLDALVIVKSFTFEDYWLAQEAVKMKIPVIFDLCDNIFIDKYRGKDGLSPSEVFLQISNIASAIVVPSEPLAAIVKQRIIRNIPVYVVPDGVETEATLAGAKNRLLLPQYIEYCYRLFHRCKRSIDQLKGKFSFIKTGSSVGILWGIVKESIKVVKSILRFLVSGVAKRVLSYLNWRFWAKLAYPYYNGISSKLTGAPSKLHPRAKTTNTVEQSNQPASFSPFLRKIVWFGNHGAEHANFGMLDLLQIREPLEKLAREFPLELVVISNNFKKFNNHIHQIEIPTRYIEWDANSMTSHLKDADVVVIPNSLDEFSICKSANRAVLALSNGVPVVATSTPALAKLRECIVLDDFENGLRHYLKDAEFASQHVHKGRELTEKLFGQQVIGRLWKELIDKALSSSLQQDNLFKPELIFAVHLPQDIELATPVLEIARKRGIQCAIWGSLAAIRRWPHLGKWIQSQSMEWRILPHDLKGIDISVFPDSAYALFSVTETNLNPHRFTHQLTKLANTAGLYTTTMQHGFENIGLSYSDDIHVIERIRIASSKIFTWGSLETLHQNIPKSLREKCIAVGCPKPETVDRVMLEEWSERGRPIIGIFENLHWHRYTEEYRNFFLDSVWQIAEVFSGVDFLIKPHNTGLWLTSRYQGEKPEMDNLTIVDPKLAQWAGITAPQLFGNLAGVITTPSTVALDAARARMPVAVVARGIDLKNYEPLSLIHCIDDWCAFVEQTIDEHGRKALLDNSRQFVNRVLLSGDATSRIVEDIMSHKQKRGNRNAAY